MTLVKHESTWSQRSKERLVKMADEADREATQATYGNRVCTLAGGGMEPETAEQNVECLLKNPQLQTLADATGEAITLSVDGEIIKTWTPS